MQDPLRVIVLLVAMACMIFGTVLLMQPPSPPRAPAPPVRMADDESTARPARAAMEYAAAKNEYPWLEELEQASLLGNRIKTPAGFTRVPMELGTFGNWLRRLPIKKGGPKVFLFNGSSRGVNEDAHAYVVDVDTGSADLQRTAQAIIRLRAEYLYSAGQNDAIKFSLLSGAPAEWSSWAQGVRSGAGTRGRSSTRRVAADSTYPNLRKYLNDLVFKKTSTATLSQDLQPVADANDIRVGDVFVRPGSPGNAAIVVDLAVNRQGRRIFLLAQGGTPAQNMHILKNLSDTRLSPWYDVVFEATLNTPACKYAKTDLRRFP